MYLTEEQFVLLGGTAPTVAGEYERLEYKARAYCDAVTMGRMKGMAVLPPSLQYLMFDLITEDVRATADADGVVSSESVGDWSVTKGERVRPNASKLANTYLAGATDDKGTPLLYRGVHVPKKGVGRRGLAVHSFGDCF